MCMCVSVVQDNAEGPGGSLYDGGGFWFGVRFGGGEVDSEIRPTAVGIVPVSTLRPCSLSSRAAVDNCIFTALSLSVSIPRRSSHDYPRGELNR